VILWRVTNHPALDGSGGLRASGRWHTRGRRILYCAPNPATALLEVLVHAEIDLEDIPATFQYIEIDAPDSIVAQTMDPGTLGAGWHTNPERTRRLGDQWLLSSQSALLRVPSVIVPATWNILVNPLHPDSKHVRIARIHAHHVDSRLLR
jgi:RES domain-containing protein